MNEFEEFKSKNPFKKIGKSFNNTVKSAERAIIGKKNQQKLAHSVNKVLGTEKKKKSTPPPPPPPPPPKPKVYALSTSNFNNNMYYDIFCPENDMKINYNTSLNQVDIISSTTKNNWTECQNACLSDNTCTSFNFDIFGKKCTLNKGYPTSTTTKGGNTSGIKTKLNFNYNNLTSAQKTNVQKYCINKKITELTGNDKISVEECIKGVKNNKNNNYIDLDAQCVWNKMNSIGKGKILNNSVRENSSKLGNAIGGKNMDKYQSDFKSLLNNSIKYFDTNKKLSNYDNDFKKYNILNQEKKEELLNDFKETSQGTIDKSILLKMINNATIGSDKKEEFTNKNYLEDSPQSKNMINIFIILIIVCLILSFYYFTS